MNAIFLSLRNARLKQAIFLLREMASAIAVALFVSILLTFVAHFWLCVGFHPETIFVADWLSPLLGVFCGAWFLSQRSSESLRGWHGGFRVAVALVALWFVVCGYLLARFDFAAWPSQVFGALSVEYLWAWSLTLLFGVAGGIVGQKMRRFKRRKPVLFAGIFVLFPLAMQLSHWFSSNTQSNTRTNEILARGVTLQTFPPTTDGTTVRFLTFDLSQRPDLSFGIYDADSDDAIVLDDQNTSWLGQSLHRVLDKAQRRIGAQSDVLCLVNGGFFGADNRWTAHYEAPLVVEGKPLYPNRVLERDWPQQAGSLGISLKNNRLQIHFLRSVRWEQPRDHQTVLGGVRGLIIDGKAQNLKPGMGGTRLLCSRTSVGWTNNSRIFYILSVRDVDGEAASLNQLAREKLGTGTQTGGWDVRQVQKFWQQMKVPNAVLFDGGESTQLAYKESDGRTVFISSAYQLSRTFGYWRSRPLRVYLPLLPPSPNHGGVLNYFYVAAPRESQR